MFTNFKIHLSLTKTKLEFAFQQQMFIYQHRIYMKDWVLFHYVITHYGNFQVCL